MHQFARFLLLNAVTAGLALLTLVGTGLAIEYRVVRSFPVAAKQACMPALTRAPGGDLLVAFSTEWEPFPWGGILKMVSSRDNGKTWSTPRILWKDKDPRVTIQAANGLQTLSNGEILLPVTYCLAPKHKEIAPDANHWLHFYNMNDPGYRREVRLLRSKDDGRSWTIEDPKLPKPWWRFGRLLETDDGRLLMPSRGAYIQSRDWGKSWGPNVSLGTPIECETNICQAADGSLFALIRQQHGLGPRRMFITTFSDDTGKSWTPWQLTNVQGKMPDLLVLPSGRILLAVGAEGLTDGGLIYQRKDRHSFCTLFVSDDHGKTWQRDVEFEPVGGRLDVVPSDSPVMCALGDGKILVVLQGLDRTTTGNPAADRTAEMSLIGNVIEPAGT